MNPFRRVSRKRRAPIKKKREKPRRVMGREKLYGEAKTTRRREIFERSGGFCEASRMIVIPSVGNNLIPDNTLVRCNAPITWESMEWSHRRHGANKSDSLEDGIASCKECHQVNTHNPKSCKRRPGKIMKIKDAKEYWSGKVCFCDGPKRPAESFCPECTPKLSDQTRYTLQHADNPDDYRQALAQAEIEILQWKAEVSE